MDDVNIQVEDVKPAPESSAEATESSDVEPKNEGETDALDYKSELSKLKKNYSKAVGALHSERERRKTAEAKLKDNPPAEIEEAAEETGDFEEKTLSILNKVEKQRIQDDVDDLIEAMSSNPDEQELIKAIYQNRITPTGFSRTALKRDLEDAQLLANRQRFLAEAEKKVKKGLAEEMAIRNVNGKFSSRVQENEPDTMTQRDKQFLDKFLGTYSKSKGGVKIK